MPSYVCSQDLWATVRLPYLPFLGILIPFYVSSELKTRHGNNVLEKIVSAGEGVVIQQY